MSLAMSRRRMDQLEALFSVAAIEMASAAAHIADDLEARDQEYLTAEEQAADRRIFVRELVAEFDRTGWDQHAANGRAELGDDTPDRINADEALLDAWAARVDVDVVALRADRVRRIQSHLRAVGVINEVLARMPRAEGERVLADLEDGGSRSTLTRRVLEVAKRRASALDDEVDA